MEHRVKDKKGGRGEAEIRDQKSEVRGRRTTRN